MTGCMSVMQGQEDACARRAAFLYISDTTDGQREEEWKEKTLGSYRETNASSRFLLVVERSKLPEWKREGYSSAGKGMYCQA